MTWIQTDSLQQSESKPKAVFAVDFDGTIVENEYPGIGRANAGAKEVLQELVEKGYRLILLTMRADDPLREAVKYCNKNNIDLFDVNKNSEAEEWSSSRKVYANVYIDDAGAGMPLKKGGNGKPCVDWEKLRELFVSWGILEKKIDAEPGVRIFEIK